VLLRESNENRGERCEMGCFFPRNYKLQFVAGSKVMTYIAFCIPYFTPPLFSKRRGRKKGLRWQICKQICGLN